MTKPYKNGGVQKIYPLNQDIELQHSLGSSMEAENQMLVNTTLKSKGPSKVLPQLRYAIAGNNGHKKLKEIASGVYQTLDRTIKSALYENLSSLDEILLPQEIDMVRQNEGEIINIEEKILAVITSNGGIPYNDSGVFEKAYDSINPKVREVFNDVYENPKIRVAVKILVGKSILAEGQGKYGPVLEGTSEFDDLYLKYSKNHSLLGENLHLHGHHTKK